MGDLLLWSRYHERGRGSISSMRAVRIDYRDEETALYIRKLAGGRRDEPVRLDHGGEGDYLVLSIAIDGQDRRACVVGGVWTVWGWDVSVREVGDDSWWGRRRAESLTRSGTQ